MSNVAPISAKILEPKPIEPSAQLVEQLEGLLADAKAGDLRSFVGVGIHMDNGVTSLWAGELTRSRFTLLGGISRMAARSLNRLFPEDAEADIT